jgi:hypothetical protein
MINLIHARKMGIGELLSLGWELYSRHFKAIFFMTVLFCIPINIIGYLFTVLNPASYTLYLCLQLLPFVCAIIGLLPVIAVITASNKGALALLSESNEKVSWAACIREAFASWGSGLFVSLIGGLIIAVLSLLLVVPGVIWAVYYTFMLQVVVLKGFGGKEALDYSKALVKGQWWTVFGMLVVFGLVSVAAGFILGFISMLLPPACTILTNTVLDMVISYFIVVQTVYFINADADYISKIEEGAVQSKPAQM